jgi:glycosyltransferase involved in cell wall biosynthesis
MGRSQARVLFVDSCIPMAGGQHSLIEVLKCLDPSRVFPVVCTPAGSGLRARCESLGFRSEPLPFESESSLAEGRSRVLWKAKDLVSSAYGVPYLAALIRKLRIDIVHPNNFKAALVATPACALAGKPMVFHDRIHITHGWLGRYVASRATRIIAVSETVRRKYGGDFDAKSVVIPPGIDTELFKPAGKIGSGNLVCYVGRISEEKDLVRLAECAPAVIRAVGDAGFVIAGIPWTDRDSAYLSGLERRIKSMGLVDRFEFPGYVEDVAGLLGRIDVFALPSAKEPLGRVMIEAMLMEKPVVAFDAGGPAEVIEHGRTGFLAKPGSAQSLAEGIVLLLKDAGLRTEIGKAARESVIDRFSNRVVAESIMGVYEDMLAGRVGAGSGHAS